MSNSLPHRSPQSSVIAYQGIMPQLHPSVFLACGARVIGDVHMGEGCGVWFNAVVRGDVHYIRIGAQTNIQDGAVIHCTFQKHPTVIGARVSIAHLAVVHGCIIEDDCLIGMGAVVMDQAVVGAGSIVGAGTVVSQGTIIPPRSLVLGTPGRVVRAVSDAEFASIAATTKRYLEYTKGYDFRDGEPG